jgi:hypothetical protein
LREVAGITFSRFLEQHNCPVLLWPQSSVMLEMGGFQFDTFSNEYSAEEPGDISPKTESQTAETLVIEIRKQTGSGPSNMICVGRAANNDIVFADKTVSKLHAYFLRAAAEDAYEIVDADSTNGTRVNGRRLIAYRNQPLLNRDRIQFGPSVEVMYLTPDGFYAMLQQLQRSGIV